MSRTLGAAGYVWLTLLAVAFFQLLQLAADRSAQVEEYPFACDAFGYLRMANEVRTSVPHGHWPQFRLRTAQTRILIDFFRAQSQPPEVWGELVAPHAHHYFPRTNEVGAQYPPGTALALALFPEGRAVYGLNRTFLWVFGSVGLLVLIGAGVFQAFASTTLAMLSIALGLDILARIGELTFSINAILPPLLVAILLALTTVALRDTGRLLVAGLVAFAAGSLLGFATLVRLPTILLAPGFLLLLWSSPLRKEFLAGPAIFLVGLALFGVCPLLVNQQHVAGAWYLPTYSAIDATSPDASVLRENVRFYLGTGLGAGDNWALVAAAFGFGALAVAMARRSTSARRCTLSWTRVAVAAFLLWAPSLMFFLTHRVTTSYYMVPGVFASIAMLGFGAVCCDLTRTRLPGDRVGRTPVALGLVAAAMLVPGLVIAQRAWTLQAQTPPSKAAGPLAHRRVALPATLANEHVWIWADLLSGTLYYYTGKPAFKVPFGDTATRLRLYRFVFERGDAQYVIRDSQDMALLMAEIGRMGGVLQPSGVVDGYPYYLIQWPRSGPTVPHQG